MSKKKKFKKFSKGQILNEIEKTSKEYVATSQSEPIKKVTKENIKIDPENAKEISYVKKDLKKVAFVFSIIIALLITISIIQSQTSWLNNIMDTVTKSLNIN